MRTSNPMLNFTVFAYGGFILVFVFNGIRTFATSSASTFMPLFLQNVIGLNAFMAGLALIIPASCMALITPLVPKLNQYFSGRLIILVGTLLITLGTWRMSNFTIATTTAILVFWVSVRYLGIGLATPILTNFAMGSVPAHLASHASAMFNWTQQMVFTASISLLTLLYDKRIMTDTANGVAAELGAIDQARWIECGAIDATNVINTILMLICIPLALLFKDSILKSKKN